MRMKWKKIVFVICAVGILLVFAMWSQTDVIYSLIMKLQKVKPYVKDPSLKYVLIWTDPTTDPFIYLGQGQETFTKRNCEVRNCYITSNKILFTSNSEFDAVLFHGPELFRVTKYDLPIERSANQSFIFASMESSDYYSVRDDGYNGYFNYTWTYKLNSDINYGYLIIRDHNGRVIGPSTTIPWMSIDNMLPISNNIKAKLKNKKIAAAWFVSNCNSRSKRENLAKNITNELKKYNMTVDVYGACGNKECPRQSKQCLEMLQRDYYFYFAFENSMSEDYVTEKLLKALQNYAVPVVYGGADYSRFMPDDIYLDANKLNVTQLVNQMVGIINDKNKYYNFFKWHNHYSYHSPEETRDTDPYCQFCDFINKVDVNLSTTVDNFKEWWNPHVT